jgi:hypothetical protein
VDDIHGDAGIGSLPGDVAVVLGARQGQPAGGDEDEMLLSLDPPHVLDAEIEVRSVLPRLCRRAEEFVQRGLVLDVEDVTAILRRPAQFVDAPLVVLVDLPRARDGSGQQRARMRTRAIEHPVDLGLDRFGNLRRGSRP